MPSRFVAKVIFYIFRGCPNKSVVAKFPENDTADNNYNPRIAMSLVVISAFRPSA